MPTGGVHGFGPWGGGISSPVCPHATNDWEGGGHGGRDYRAYVGAQQPGGDRQGVGAAASRSEMLRNTCSRVGCDGATPRGNGRGLRPQLSVEPRTHWVSYNEFYVKSMM